MINETRKILKKPNLKVTATTVRVPVINCHSEAINVEFEKDFDIDELKNKLKSSKGIVLEDDPQNNLYPLATKANNHDEVYVGRIRRDESVPFGINFWCVADNIRKGAATNAIQIVQELINNDK
jgi:aspartate-semialdehyde dehydrogenase